MNTASAESWLKPAAGVRGRSQEHLKVVEPASESALRQQPVPPCSEEDLPPQPKPLLTVPSGFIFIP